MNEAEYETSDQQMCRSLIALGAKIKRVETKGTNMHMVYVFSPMEEVMNAGRKFTVKQLIEKILLGDTDDLAVTLKNMLISDNVWTMNIRHRDVLSNKG